MPEAPIMRKLLTFFALLSLLGLAGWGVVVAGPRDPKAPPATPASSTSVLSPAAEMALERAAYRVRTVKRWQEQQRAAAEAKRLATLKAAERMAQQQRAQQDADQQDDAQDSTSTCYPAGCVPPVDPELPDAPDNAGQPDGPYCYASPTGKVCTTY